MDNNNVNLVKDILLGDKYSDDDTYLNSENTGKQFDNNDVPDLCIPIIKIIVGLFSIYNLK